MSGIGGLTKRLYTGAGSRGSSGSRRITISTKINMENTTQQMSILEVSELMLSSLTEDQWNRNCDKVKKAFNGQYPDWWYKEIVLSGLMGSVTADFKKQ